MVSCRLPMLAVVLITAVLFIPRPAHGQAPYHSDYERTLDLLAASKVVPSDLPQIPAPGRKSVLLAALYSLAVPGMGELYAESFSSGKYFLGAEGVLWLTYAAFDIHATELQNDARAFAAVHAGVDATGKSDEFYVDVGNFLTVEDYNAKKMRDRSPELLYDPAAGYNWAWDSDLNRATFRDQRITSANVFNNRKFVVAAILVNHVASAINAARAAIARNKEAAAPLGDLRLEASVMGGWLRPHGILFTLSRPL
ncbi:MAG TPA: hypothetical protein VF889_02280 [Bacteroidota bacterium]